MLQTSTRTVGAPLTIVGKDLDVGSTFNGDLNPTAGKQRAGRFMSYDTGTKQLTPWDGLADAAGATVFGVLADVIYTVGSDTADVSTAVMVYREGVFLRQEIEAANNAHIEPDGPLDKALRALGIFLEYSYEDYVGVQPVPQGAGQIP